MSSSDLSTSRRDLHAILGDLVFSAHRLTRIAAHSTSSTESPAIWRTLDALNTSGPMRTGELARHGRVSQPTMSKIIRLLEQRGWVARVADPTDARATVLELSAEGRAALANWRETVLTALTPRFEALSDEQLNTLDSAAGILAELVSISGSVGPGAPEVAELPEEGEPTESVVSGSADAAGSGSAADSGSADDSDSDASAAREARA
ncbi:DNA-binding MarR family transcriptional regulator [Mycetocola sp. BIGb0189]|uniref:MarR family winged helix-turn-helix transcriptional regulator n=1 Tax=Mycetocola sp. BIGb0189 TaxID=2940604 RepID=UPI0021672B29|nr:MarR family transcriptional regulator [Mycetocola sp. BIGb0189]MCS4276319.1 DNA-binding MarR family transcriptional regulator [Mycetocola sp. BIGb0189]